MRQGRYRFGDLPVAELLGMPLLRSYRQLGTLLLVKIKLLRSHGLVCSNALFQQSTQRSRVRLGYTRYPIVPHYTRLDFEDEDDDECEHDAPGRGAGLTVAISLEKW